MSAPASDLGQGLLITLGKTRIPLSRRIGAVTFFHSKAATRLLFTLNQRILLLLPGQQKKPL